MTSSDIRPIVLADIESVFEIEKASFPDPWQEEIFYQLTLSNGRYPVDESTLIIMDVMGEKGAVDGYIIWEEDEIDNHGHILNLAVDKILRRQGKGQKLLNHALSSMISAGIKTCELEVRESNHWARHLYEHAGMMAVDRRVDYYESEDAIIYAITFS